MDNPGFIFRLAWRDARRERAMLWMFMSSIILGIAALVAINAFNDALLKDVDRQAATLLGADLELSSNSVIPDTVMSVFDSVIVDRSEEREVLSMAYFPQKDESQFVRVLAIDGGFPYYGEILAKPSGVIEKIKSKDGAVVDEGLLNELDLSIGDTLILGDLKMLISGSLQRAFGGSGLSSSFAPVIYIGVPSLDKTNLIQPGSLVDYNRFFKTKDGFDIDDLVNQHKSFIRNQGVRTETIASQKEDLNEAFESLNSFLNIVALVALLLGCIGVSSSIFVYVRRKTKSIAIFRCLGLTGQQAMFVFLTQVLVLGFISVLIGIVLGSMLQLILPYLLSDFLPLDVTVGLSTAAMLEGLVIGSVLTMLFALWPLLQVKEIAPIRVLRDVNTRDGSWRSRAILTVGMLIVVALGLTLWYLTGSWMDGGIMLIGLLVAFALLFGLSEVFGRWLRKAIPRRLAFVWRQGMANLYRPNNQTSTLIVSIGLGTGVLATLFIIRGLLLNNIAQMDAGNQPNVILFGIETNQRDSLRDVTREFEMPVLQEVPIVTMRLVEWQGRTKTEWLSDTTREAENWVIHREARVTYRDSLDETETLLRGDFRGTVVRDSIFISLSDRYAKALAVDIGDELVFNVQGTRMKTYVSSIREIDFSTMQARFFIVFPTGVLESAPQFHVMVTKSPNAETTSSYRSDVVERFSNVSVVDLSSILETVNQIFGKISYVVQFMAAFSILTGLMVLISSLWLSKYQRVRENALLRTLGASNRQLLGINATEYALIGVLSSLSGIVIALAASFLIAVFQLELDFLINWWSLILVFLSVTGLTVVIGLWNTREVMRTRPIEVLK